MNGIATSPDFSRDGESVEATEDLLFQEEADEALLDNAIVSQLRFA